MKRYLLLVFLLASIASCSEYPPIDSDLSFNVARSVDFIIPAAVDTGMDTNLTAIGKIDTLNSYDTNGTYMPLLRTSEVWRCYLHSNDENFTIDQLVYARVLIGTDTIAFDSIPQGSSDPFYLNVTKKDITKLMQDTSYTATLECKFLSSPASPVTITCGMTVVYTAVSNTTSQ